MTDYTWSYTMPSKTSGLFQVKTWDEEPYCELDDGRKFTRATVTMAYSGEIEGEGRVEYTMAYLADQTTCFTGIEYIIGTVAGRSGSFAIRHIGRYADGKANSRWKVIPGAGSGELTELRGEGGFETLDHERAAYHFENESY